MIRFAAILLLALPLTACTSITAEDEVEALQKSSEAFAGSLRRAASAKTSALAAAQREEYRRDVLSGEPVVISTACREAANAANSRLEEALFAATYYPAVADEAYQSLQAIVPCDTPSAQPERAKPSKIDPGVGNLAFTSTGSPTLPGSARAIVRYVDALADVATGKTAADTDAARTRLITAGSGLLATLGVSGPVEAIANLANQAISSIAAARRNEATRQFLNGMDPAIAPLMEGLGTAARFAHAEAAFNRARASEAVASWANRALNQPEMVDMPTGRARHATAARLAQYDNAIARLAGHNDEFLALTAEDPMRAPRAFAGAHHELTLLYNNPRASRQNIAAGLANFQEAASLYA